MAPKSPFPPAQEDWIKPQIAEYLLKTMYGKEWIHGQPPPKDDSDLTKWVEQRGEDLENAFPDFYKALPPKELDSLRKKFATKFRNTKNDEKERLHKRFFDAYFALPFIPTSNEHQPATATVPPMTSPPFQGNKPNFSLLDPIPPPSARDLFIAENKTKINEAAKLEREKRGVNHHHHAAIFQSKSKEFFDAMSNAEKEEWNKRARDMEVGQDIYQNQRRLAYEMTCVLNSLIGDGPHQVGNASLTLFFGYRDEHENIQLGSVSSATDGSPLFNAEESWDGVVDGWVKYTKTIPYNRPPNCKNANTLEHPPSGPPMFPYFDDATPAEELRKFVKEFVELQWAGANDGSIPWSEIEVNRSQYISPEIPSSLPIATPNNLSKGNIIDLADYLKGRAVTLFLPQSKPNPPKNPSSPTKPSTKDLSDASVETLWRKVAGQVPAPPGRSPSPVPSLKGMAKGNNDEGGEQDGGADIIDVVSPPEGDDSTDITKDDDEKQRNANGSSANGSTGAGGGGDDGAEEDKGLEDDDILEPENRGDDNEESLDANPSASGGILRGGRGGTVRRGGRRGGRGGRVEQKKRKAGDNDGGEGPQKRPKKSEQKPQQPEPVLRRSGRSQKDKNTAPKEEIEYKPYPGYKGYVLAATPKKRK